MAEWILSPDPPQARYRRRCQEGHVHAFRMFAAALFVGVGLAWASANQAAPAGGATLFEGARLIVGDGRAPIDNSAFLGEGNRIARVGKKGDVRAPADATRVDLTGQTAMPALIHIHNHLGGADL